MKVINYSFLLSFGIVSFFSVLNSQEKDFDLKKIEKKWGLEEEDSKIVIKKKKNTENPIPIFLTQFQPVKQEFPINPTMENIIEGKMGTKITIPANSISLPMSYRRGDILTIELIEVYNDLDFITSGISLEYFDPKPHIFESGGMFKLSVSYYDKPLNLKRGVKLKVEMPNLISTNKKMNMYKLDDKVGWVDKGSMPLDTKSSSSVNDDLPREGNQERSYLFKAMDDFKWWNCDYPNPDITCIQGKVIPLADNMSLSVTSVGIDYKNASTRYVDSSNQFQMNVIKGKRVKLIIMDSKGNIGLSGELNTGNSEAFLTEDSKSKCSDIGVIQIKKVDREILKDRTKLLNHLGLFDLK